MQKVTFNLDGNIYPSLTSTGVKLQPTVACSVVFSTSRYSALNGDTSSYSNHQSSLITRTLPLFRGNFKANTNRNEQSRANSDQLKRAGAAPTNENLGSIH